MSNQDALNELIQRFAISALSRERKHEAVNEEMLVGKYTGEFYIKTKDGVVLSADILNRNRVATNDAIRVAELMGMTGDLYNVEIDGLQLPAHIDHSVNILQNDHIQLPVDVKEILVYIDLDEYDILEDNVIPVYTKGEVKFLFEIIRNGITEYVRSDCDLSTVNFTKIALNAEGASSIKLVNITINKENKVYTSDGADRALLLHNVYITVNR